MTHDRTYIGDGVYASHDGFHLWLHTSNGIRDTNEIALDPQVVDNFLIYLTNLRAQIKAQHEFIEDHNTQ